MDHIVSSKLVSLLGFLANIFVYALGGYIIIVRGKYSAELIVAVAGYTQLFIGDVTSAVNLNIDLGVLQASLDRIKELLTYTESSDMAVEKKKQIDKIETISFRDVVFTYNENEKVLSGLDLEISKGDKIAIIGENGSGKSTLIKLLLGYFTADSGKISINGIPIEYLDVDTYYSNLSVVNQNPVLFSGTVRENIGGKVSIHNLKNLLNVDDEFLTKQVGFMGNDLSSGEKQKVAILRGLLNDSDLYILDEFGNHIDSVSYNNILQYIQTEMYGKTILCITHDHFTLSFFDKIIHIKNGTVKVEVNERRK